MGTVDCKAGYSAVRLCSIETVDPGPSREGVQVPAGGTSPQDHVSKEQMHCPGSIPGSGRSPGEGHGYPLQQFLPGQSHGQWSLAGYTPWGQNESDTNERLSLLLFNKRRSPHCLRSRDHTSPFCWSPPSLPSCSSHLSQLTPAPVLSCLIKHRSYFLPDHPLRLKAPK